MRRLPHSIPPPAGYGRPVRREGPSTLLFCRTKQPYSGRSTRYGVPVGLPGAEREGLIRKRISFFIRQHPLSWNRNLHGSGMRSDKYYPHTSTPYIFSAYHGRKANVKNHIKIPPPERGEEQEGGGRDGHISSSGSGDSTTVTQAGG